METAHKVDKSKWPVGPWSTEPDKLEWRDAETGLPCLLVRVGHHGALCGYVAVPPAHPAHGLRWSADALENISVHGGLSYSDKCDAGGSICYKANQGEPDDVWWLGFDCAHSGDLAPRLGSSSRETYRDVPYVQAECRSLARQLAKLGGR